jgi:hypothetical protein
MKNKKRAIRRHHRERMLAKRYLQAKSYRPYTVTHQDEWDAFERRCYLTAHHMLHTPCLCSNPVCCGNPRRLKSQESLTLQERRNVLSFEEQIGDADDILVEI